MEDDFAKPFLEVKLFNIEDLPTFERPKKATSATFGAGESFTLCADCKNFASTIVIILFPYYHDQHL